MNEDIKLVQYLQIRHIFVEIYEAYEPLTIPKGFPVLVI